MTDILKYFPIVLILLCFRLIIVVLSKLSRPHPPKKQKNTTLPKPTSPPVDLARLQELQQSAAMEALENADSLDDFLESELDVFSATHSPLNTFKLTKEDWSRPWQITGTWWYFCTKKK